MKWSNDIKTLVGNVSFKSEYSRVFLRGKIKVTKNNYFKMTYGSGDSCSIKQGHNKWIV